MFRHLAKHSAKWFFLRVVVPFLFVGLFWIVESSSVDTSMEQAVSTIGFMWWGFGVGVWGVKELFDVLDYGWRKTAVKTFIAALLVFLYFSATIHAVMIFCGSVISVNQDLPLLYIISAVVVVLSWFSHCVLKSFLYKRPK